MTATVDQRRRARRATPMPISLDVAMERVETLLSQIAGKNDLSKSPPEHLCSDAMGALHDCELLAREALEEALPAAISEISRVREESERVKDERERVFKLFREARDAYHNVQYPEGIPEVLRTVADEIDCGADCESGSREYDTGAYTCSHDDAPGLGCRSSTANYLRELATTFEAVPKYRAEALAAVEDAQPYKDALYDIMMLESEAFAIGGGPGFKERREKAWQTARELFEP